MQPWLPWKWTCWEPNLRAWELGVPVLAGQCSLGPPGHRVPDPTGEGFLPTCLPLVCSSLPWLHGNSRMYSLVLYLCLL